MEEEISCLTAAFKCKWAGRSVTFEPLVSKAFAGDVLTGALAFSSTLGNFLAESTAWLNDVIFISLGLSGDFSFLVPSKAPSLMACCALSFPAGDSAPPKSRVCWAE